MLVDSIIRDFRNFSNPFYAVANFCPSYLILSKQICLTHHFKIFIVVHTILFIFEKGHGLRILREHFNKPKEVIKMARKKFKVLIVDDEPDSLSLLRAMLEEIPNVEVVGDADHSEKAFYLILERLPNLVLLDINMPGNSGTDLKKLLNKSLVDVPVVFVSANKAFAVDAIRNGVYDFLPKPIIKEELQGIIEKYQRLNHQFFPGRIVDIVNAIPEDVKIRINSQHSYILINPYDIIYCQSADGATFIYLTNGKKEVTNSNLTQLEQMLKRWNFHRLGRSLLINLDHIRKIDKAKSKCYFKKALKTWEVNAPQQAAKELLSSYNFYA